MNDKPHKPRYARTGSAGIMAKNFLRNLDAGMMVDRTMPYRKKTAMKRKVAPSQLMKFAQRPRPQALESPEG